MEFYPKNKYLLVEPADTKKPEEKTSGFILPEDYKKVETHKLMKIVRACAGSEYSVTGLKGHHVLVPSQMVEQITVANKVLHLVPENAIVGLFIGE